MSLLSVSGLETQGYLTLLLNQDRSRLNRGTEVRFVTLKRKQCLKKRRVHANGNGHVYLIEGGNGSAFTSESDPEDKECGYSEREKLRIFTEIETGQWNWQPSMVSKI